MAITAEMVKNLRERTGAGMMECKTALTESNGDVDAAIEYLRKRGLAQAAKRAGRGVRESAQAEAPVAVGPDGEAVGKSGGEPLRAQQRPRPTTPKVEPATPASV